MQITQEIQSLARELLTSRQVNCVIGYEAGTHGNVRPVFVYNEESVSKLTWNNDCTHNLTRYLTEKIKSPEDKIAVVVKPCDSRTINVFIAENKLERSQVHIIAVSCDGIRDSKTNSNSQDQELQLRCQLCDQRTPVVYDTLIGDPVPNDISSQPHDLLNEIEQRSTEERAEFWLEQFDHCIRCYACRQVCPMCDCPTCLFERDDSLYVGASIGISEKRFFHLGRAYHLAGRCVGCNECERVCPMNIPISLLNRRLAQEIETLFDFKPGLEPEVSPITTLLSEEVRK
jgi:ferredoxin